MRKCYYLLFFGTNYGLFLTFALVFFPEYNLLLTVFYSLGLSFIALLAERARLRKKKTSLLQKRKKEKEEGR